MEDFMIKKIAVLFLAIFLLFSCNQIQSTEEESGATVIFSSLQEGRGRVIALVDGKEINSGDKVAKGKIVSFSATPSSDRYIIRRWQGAAYNEATINEAFLNIKDEKTTYSVRADFGNIVNFMRINSGDVKGEAVVPDITKERLDEIIKGNQTIKVKGPSVTIVVASTDVAWNERGFKVNGEVKQTMAYDIYKTAGVVVFNDLEVGKPFDVECIQSVASHSFTFKFKLLREDGLVDVPRVNLAIDDKKPEPMTENTLKELANGSKPNFYSKKDPEIEISSSRDVIKEVVLQESGGTPSVLTPIAQNLAAGKKYYTRFYINNIPLENAGEPREIKITIKPKDETKYAEVVWVFCLKQFDETDSPEFQGEVSGTGSFEPNIIKGMEWYDGKTHKYIDDYGSKGMILTVQTVSKEASVYYQIVDLDGNPYNGSEEKLMTNNHDTSHKSEKIVLFENKPTKIKAWVVSRTGKRRNDARGVWTFTANPVLIRCGYLFTDDPAKVQGEGYTEGYDVIKINKNKVKDGKVYVSFGIWDAYKVGTEGLATEQKPFVKMKQNDANIQIQWYTTEVNISHLVDDNKESLEISLPILEGETLCFTCKVTLRLE